MVEKPVKAGASYKAFTAFVGGTAGFLSGKYLVSKILSDLGYGKATCKVGNLFDKLTNAVIPKNDNKLPFISKEGVCFHIRKWSPYALGILGMFIAWKAGK